MKARGKKNQWTENALLTLWTWNLSCQQNKHSMQWLWCNFSRIWFHWVSFFLFWTWHCSFVEICKKKTFWVISSFKRPQWIDDIPPCVTHDTTSWSVVSVSVCVCVKMTASVLVRSRTVAGVPLMLLGNELVFWLIHHSLADMPRNLSWELKSVYQAWRRPALKNVFLMFMSSKKSDLGHAGLYPCKFLTQAVFTHSFTGGSDVSAVPLNLWFTLYVIRQKL